MCEYCEKGVPFQGTSKQDKLTILRNHLNYSPNQKGDGFCVLISYCPKCGRCLHHGSTLLEGLGYNKNEFEGDILFQKRSEDETKQRNILFRSDEKCVACFDEDEHGMLFTMDELFAISLYCKELGWQTE